ncbi:unnamed protein product [Ectocarpus sp. CCAP 1310/34]|nr:unnamed protein product [Ectocarpus sp. CCAP 1310/34]
MHTEGLVPDSLTIVIAACDRSGAWDVALMMLDDAREEEDGGDGENEGRRVKTKGKANVFAYTAAISACGKAGRWEEAVGLLDVLDLMHACAASAQPADNPPGFNRTLEGGRESVGGDAHWGADGGSSSGLVQAYNHVIRACGAAGGAEFVLALLQEMHRRGVPPDAASYSGGIIACDLAGMWREAVGLLDDMRQETGIEPDLVCYNCAVKACGSSGEFEQALSIVETMGKRGVAPDESTYSNAITACGNAGKAKIAVGLLQAMKDDGVPAGLVAHNAAIGACDKAAECSLALSVLKDMRSARIRPDAISYAGAISSCDKAGEWRLTLGLYDQMVADMAADASASSADYEAEAYQPRRGESGVSSRTEGVSKGPGVLLPPPRATVAALTACARGGQWEKAVGILRDVQNNTGRVEVDRSGSGDHSSGNGGSGVCTYFNQASSLAFNAALVACAKGAEMEAAEGREGGWREALEVLDMVSGSLLGASIIRARDDAAREILDSMASEGVEPDARCYRFAAEAFGQSGDGNDASPEAEQFSKIAERLELEAAGKDPRRRGGGGGGGDGAISCGLDEALSDMGISGTAGLEELLAKAGDVEFRSVGRDEETT